jgi:predicted TIM-barrel fold metal-dependent hydrolase
MGPMRVDLHQHVWTEGLCAALASRADPPRLVRDDRGWTLELAGEAPFAMPGAPDDPAGREAGLAGQGVDLAVVALSSALGIEDLPADEARDVIAAWDDDADALPASLPAWGAVALADAAPADIDALLDRGRIGLCLPATAMESPDALDRVGPLLERLAARGAPLFVHPGPAPAGAWLPPLTAYVASLTAAWLAWAVHGRDAHGELRVVFAALAGLAPLHAERLAARGHPEAAQRALADPLTFLDTSCYGPRAVDAIVRAVGTGVIVHGSDWPYAEPVLPAAELRRSVLEDNPAVVVRGRAGMVTP